MQKTYVCIFVGFLMVVMDCLVLLIYHCKFASSRVLEEEGVGEGVNLHKANSFR